MCSIGKLRLCKPKQQIREKHKGEYWVLNVSKELHTFLGISASHCLIQMGP